MKKQVLVPERSFVATVNVPACAAHSGFDLTVTVHGRNVTEAEAEGRVRYPGATVVVRSELR